MNFVWILWSFFFSLSSVRVPNGVQRSLESWYCYIAVAEPKAPHFWPVSQEHKTSSRNLQKAVITPFSVDTLNKHVSGSHSAGSDFVQIQIQTLFEPALETNVCYDRAKLTLIVTSQA